MEVTHTLYQIIDWNVHYENAKSRTIEDCKKCILPNKQDGLGYGRLVRLPNGEALYGAFVAVAMVCSKQKSTSKYPREGYLTDTGRADGYPLTAADLSIKTQLSEKTIQTMLDAVCLENINWIRRTVIKRQVSAGCPPGIPQVSAKGYLDALEGRKEGRKEGTPPALSKVERISSERELREITRELEKRGSLSDYTKGSATYARMQKLVSRQNELRELLGVLA
jgi:hypothetical protein